MKPRNAAADTPEFDRLVLIFSDVEMGPGGVEDDFPHSDFLGEILLSYLEGPSHHRLDVVFNGDTFDLLKTPYLGTYPHHITKDVAMGKMASVAAAHPRLFEALSRLLEFPGGDRQVHFVLGNHDLELAFPKVQGFIRALCGAPDRVQFPGFELAIGPVLIEHGSQWDPLFRVDPSKLFIQHDGKTLLNITWATVPLLDVIIPLKPLLYFHDRLVPKARVMALVPEIRELIIGLVWKYWTKDFWRDFFELRDPVLKLNWSMFKEIVKRFTTGNTNVSFRKNWLVETVGKQPYELFVTGHLHTIGTGYHGSKRTLHAGAFRDEYFVDDEGRSFTPLLKPYYEVYLKKDQIVGIVTREVQGPARPPESIPESIYEVVPRVRELLDELGDRAKDRAKQEEQERRDALEAAKERGESKESKAGIDLMSDTAGKVALARTSGAEAKGEK